MRAMSTDKLLKTLPTLQAQLDALLEFDCQANDLTNGEYFINFFVNIQKCCPQVLSMLLSCYCSEI